MVDLLISVDGIDISLVPLAKLRSSLSIISQDPAIYKGTVRFNIDPSGRFDDAQLWDALDKVHLKKWAKSLPGRLDAEMSENGSSMSAGQRQLFCIGRSLLSRYFVLLLFSQLILVRKF